MRSFDQTFRVVVLFALAPLSDHSVGERALGKVTRELQAYSAASAVKHTLGILTMLRLAGAGIGLIALVSLGLALAVFLG